MAHCHFFTHLTVNGVPYLTFYLGRILPYIISTTTTDLFFMFVSDYRLFNVLRLERLQRSSYLHYIQAQRLLRDYSIFHGDRAMGLSLKRRTAREGHARVPGSWQRAM